MAPEQRHKRGRADSKKRSNSPHRGRTSRDGSAVVEKTHERSPGLTLSGGEGDLVLTTKKNKAQDRSSTPRESRPAKRGTRQPVRRGPQRSIREELLSLFQSSPGELFKTNEISKMIGIKSTDPLYQELRDTIQQMDDAGEIVRGSRRRYGLAAPKESAIEGTLTIQPSTGNGILEPDAKYRMKDTILIRARSLQTAMEGDRVRVLLFAQKPGERPQGEVIEVLTKASRSIIGRVVRGRGHYFVKPESEKYHRDILVTRRDLYGAKEGDKVRVELFDWEDEHHDPEGHVVEILNGGNAFQDEMEAIAAEHGLPAEFPSDVHAEAEAIPEQIPEEEIAKRLDLRSKTIITIDPEDAKDFDDAISLEYNEDGTLTLGVHIADVSHYVQEGTPLDREALERGTSVYLVGGVIPMLPERLSNGVCSLRPNEDKLTYSVLMTVDAETGKVKKSEFKKTVIRSARRFSYEEAESRIVTGEGDMAPELREMRELAQKMYALRSKAGSIDFETDEVRFKFDDSGTPVSSYKKERLNSMRMIEDFMLAANRAVAEYISKKAKQGAELPFLYRIHADPDPTKLRDLSTLAKALGYKLNVENPTPKVIQKFLESIKGKPEEKMLNQLMLRAMAKAVYAEHNVGHFGLAFLHYTHFTSPIRRYPDLIVHRMLFEYQQRGGMKPAREHYYFNALPDIADQTSALERRATDAERESNKVAQMFLLKDLIGEEFDATISGVQHFGIFVQLDTGAEGLVHIRELPGRYMFDEAHYRLVPATNGYRSNSHSSETKGFRIGDRLRVQLIRVRIERREVDFRLAEDVY